MNSNSGAELKRYIKEIIAPGDENGNGRVVRFRMSSGLEIIGLPTKNFYGGQWDLGPTWNYVVLADKPFLVDAGRFGQGKKLVGMMQAAGINPADLTFVLISHGHEDHDGGLAELVKFTHLKVKAHAIYELLIRKYPADAPPGPKENFPAKCWHCFMPESFYTANCLGYHRVLQQLAVDSIGSGENELMADIHNLTSQMLGLGIAGFFLIMLVKTPNFASYSIVLAQCPRSIDSLSSNDINSLQHLQCPHCNILQITNGSCHHKQGAFST